MLEDAQPVQLEFDVYVDVHRLVDALKGVSADRLEVLEVHMDIVKMSQFLRGCNEYIEILSVSASCTRALITG